MVLMDRPKRVLTWGPKYGIMVDRITSRVILFTVSMKEGSDDL